MNTIASISTEELIELQHKKETKIIDARPVEAYNGWKLQDEKRGGHIKGARCIPVKWAEWIDWIEIVRSKGIETTDAVVIYAYEKADALKVAERFVKSGYTKVSIYEQFVSEWSANEELEMDFLPKYKTLVYPDWLKTLLDGGTPPEYDNENFVVCHGHYQNPEDYAEGHIPGAISVDTNTLEDPTTWNRRTPEELKETLEGYGITSDTTVILYGRFSFPNNDDMFPGSSAGHLGSIRAAFIMMYAGVKDVRVLNGGLLSWSEAGYGLSKDHEEPVNRGVFGVQIPARPDLAVDVSEAKEIIASGDANLVSVRSWPEYIGEVSGYNYIKPKGRIPGSVFGNCGTDAYHMENYRNLDHTTREFGETVEIWKEIGITPDKHNAFYCGTGWRGSEAWFNAWLLGWPRVAVFDGGWFEWSADPNNPTATGFVSLEVLLGILRGRTV